MSTVIDPTKQDTHSRCTSCGYVHPITDPSKVQPLPVQMPVIPVAPILPVVPQLTRCPLCGETFVLAGLYDAHRVRNCAPAPEEPAPAPLPVEPTPEPLPVEPTPEPLPVDPPPVDPQPIE